VTGLWLNDEIGQLRNVKKEEDLDWIEGICFNFSIWTFYRRAIPRILTFCGVIDLMSDF
jgi:hypothetical protein